MTKTIVIESGAMITSREAASLIGISEGVLRNWRSAGKGPRFVRLSRRHGPVRYVRSDVERFLAECYARSA